MNIATLFKRLLPGCPAEKLLEANAAATQEVRELLGETVQSVTTVYDRRAQNVTPITERRKARG